MFQANPDTTYLAGLSIKEGWRGQGIGEYLLQRCIDVSRANNRKRIVFYTIDDLAHDFYARFNANLKKVRDDFWLGEIELDTLAPASYTLPSQYTVRVEEGETTLFTIGGLAAAFDERYCFIVYAYDGDQCIGDSRIKI